MVYIGMTNNMRRRRDDHFAPIQKALREDFIPDKKTYRPALVAIGHPYLKYRFVPLLGFPNLAWTIIKPEEGPIVRSLLMLLESLLQRLYKTSEKRTSPIPTHLEGNGAFSLKENPIQVQFDCRSDLGALCAPKPLRHSRCPVLFRSTYTSCTTPTTVVTIVASRETRAI